MLFVWRFFLYFHVAKRKNCAMAREDNLCSASPIS